MVRNRELRRAECGAATVVLPLVVWFATLVAIGLVDMTGYLLAASRAQALADAAALAAVSADAVVDPDRTPRGNAERVTNAGGGDLERCACARGRAETIVSVSVPGLFLPSIGAMRVRAGARAALAPPTDLAPGPTSERARWVLPRGP